MEKAIYNRKKCFGIVRVRNSSRVSFFSKSPKNNNFGFSPFLTIKAIIVAL
jgi:hypothetical protein